MQDLPKIGLDLDGVLIDHSASKRLLASKHGVHLERWQTNSNVIQRFVPRETYRKIQNEIYTVLTLEAPIMPGALDVLGGVKADFYIVSGRRVETIRFVQRWLCVNRVYDVIPAERIFFCGTGEDKRAHCERLGFHCFLDDNLSVLNVLPRKLDRVLFDADGVGVHLDPDESVKVVSGWSDFRRFLVG
jgi:hypothetical protein